MRSSTSDLDPEPSLGRRPALIAMIGGALLSAAVYHFELAQLPVTLSLLILAFLVQRQKRHLGPVLGLLLLAPQFVYLHRLLTAESSILPGLEAKTVCGLIFLFLLGVELLLSQHWSSVLLITGCEAFVLTTCAQETLPLWGEFPWWVIFILGWLFSAGCLEVTATWKGQRWRLPQWVFFLLLVAVKMGVLFGGALSAWADFTACLALSGVWLNWAAWQSGDVSVCREPAQLIYWEPDPREIRHLPRRSPGNSAGRTCHFNLGWLRNLPRQLLDEAAHRDGRQGLWLFTWIGVVPTLLLVTLVIGVLPFWEELRAQGNVLELGIVLLGLRTAGRILARTLPSPAHRQKDPQEIWARRAFGVLYLNVLALAFAALAGLAGLGIPGSTAGPLKVTLILLLLARFARQDQLGLYWPRFLPAFGLALVFFELYALTGMATDPPNTLLTEASDPVLKLFFFVVLLAHLLNQLVCLRPLCFLPMTTVLALGLSQSSSSLWEAAVVIGTTVMFFSSLALVGHTEVPRPCNCNKNRPSAPCWASDCVWSGLPAKYLVANPPAYQPSPTYEAFSFREREIGGQRVRPCEVANPVASEEWLRTILYEQNVRWVFFDRQAAWRVPPPRGRGAAREGVTKLHSDARTFCRPLGTYNDRDWTLELICAAPQRDPVPPPPQPPPLEPWVVEQLIDITQRHTSNLGLWRLSGGLLQVCFVVFQFLQLQYGTPREWTLALAPLVCCSLWLSNHVGKEQRDRWLAVTPGPRDGDSD